MTGVVVLVAVLVVLAVVAAATGRASRRIRGRADRTVQLRWEDR